MLQADDPLLHIGDLRLKLGVGSLPRIDEGMVLSDSLGQVARLLAAVRLEDKQGVERKWIGGRVRLSLERSKLQSSGTAPRHQLF